ncbi:metal-dependent hydrolase [Tepidibacillus fermentans]|uniref:Inner membrane protein n=1 Tax=Tepidibacillus fermentans TaxID=1281767 RepID=A0A4R3KHQ8_9BACI|nr:metal-dependent hydrolase [Tepidibacillus fermentans]TCS82579.1 inner membrane protein [Tepidibacillus fermentans]
MDTGTHFVIGVSLAGLAHFDPVVQFQLLFAQAVLMGTIAGSQAPDLDGITRFFGGTANYIKHHRGISHSLPFLLIWPSLITFVIQFFYPNIPIPHLWLWTFLAVFLHVLLDILNAYGTQVLRPFSEKWIALNVMNIFDPFIFLTHILGIFLWITNIGRPVTVFILVYLITFTYIGWRFITHHNLLKKIKLEKKLEGNVTLLPTIRWSVWNLIEELPQKYRMGVLRNRNIEWVDEKIKIEEHPSIRSAKQDPKVRNFLYFTNYAYPTWKKTDYGYEVKWIDLRYRFQDHYPFLAIVLLNESYQIIDSYVGWVYNQKQLSKKIESLLSLHNT